MAITGSGTSGDPFLINTLADLQLIGSGSPYLVSSYYTLNANIDATATSTWNSGAGFIPLCKSVGFTGVFNGNGYTISNLFINNTTTNSAGLFGTIGAGGIVHDLNLTSVNITNTSSYPIGALCGYKNDVIANQNTPTIYNITINGGTVNGQYTGGLIGECESYSYIQNCQVIGVNVTSTQSGVGGVVGVITTGYVTFKNCNYQGGTVTGVTYVGGFVGACTSTSTIFTQCYSTGTVSNTGDKTGGFVGTALGIYSDCYSTCKVTGTTLVGGFAGHLSPTSPGPTMIRCYATGLVSGTTKGGFSADLNGTVTNCFWDKTTTNQPTSGAGTGYVTASMMLQATYTGFDFTTVPVWVINPANNGGYPYLYANHPVFVNPVLKFTGSIVDVSNISSNIKNLKRVNSSIGDVSNVLGNVKKNIRIVSPLNNVSSVLSNVKNNKRIIGTLIDISNLTGLVKTKQRITGSLTNTSSITSLIKNLKKITTTNLTNITSINGLVKNVKRVTGNIIDISHLNISFHEIKRIIGTINTFSILNSNVKKKQKITANINDTSTILIHFKNILRGIGSINTSSFLESNIIKQLKVSTQITNTSTISFTHIKKILRILGNINTSTFLLSNVKKQIKILATINDNSHLQSTLNYILKITGTIADNSFITGTAIFYKYIEFIKGYFKINKPKTIITIQKPHTIIEIINK